MPAKGTRSTRGAGREKGAAGEPAPKSCAECRRLKLKCDKNVPCDSCVKRGCEIICPNGSLTQGPGHRYVLAGTEELHEKIFEMAKRIRQLEEALQGFCPRHELLDLNLLNIKSSLEVHGAPKIGANGDTLPETELEEGDHSVAGMPTDLSTGKEKYYGRTARVEYLVILDDSDDEASNKTAEIREFGSERLPQAIRGLSHSFPCRWADKPGGDLEMRRKLLEQRPPFHIAKYLCEQAQQNAMWSYDVNPQGNLIAEVLQHCYCTTLSLDEVMPHTLALLYITMAIGTCVDMQPGTGIAAEWNDPEVFHHLCRASLSELSVVEDTTFHGVCALFFMTWYLIVYTERKDMKAINFAWAMMGMTVKLAQSIGLHDESATWNISPDDVQRRRCLLWEMMYMDTRLSLLMGRPPSFSPQTIHSNKPNYNFGFTERPLTTLYHEWKHGFLVQCVNAVSEATVSIKAKAIKYSRILNLDSIIRDYPVPKELKSVHASWNNQNVAPTRGLAMQQAVLEIGRHLMLLQLHRRFFVKALTSPENSPHRKDFMPSILATYRSSCTVIYCLELLRRQQPELSARFGFFWSDGFCAAMSLLMLVFHAPLSPLARTALEEIQKIRESFRLAAPTTLKAAVCLPHLKKFTDMAERRLVSELDESLLNEFDALYLGSARTPDRRFSPPVDSPVTVEPAGATKDMSEYMHPHLKTYFQDKFPSTNMVSLSHAQDSPLLSSTSVPADPEPSMAPQSYPSAQAAPNPVLRDTWEQVSWPPDQFYQNIAEQVDQWQQPAFAQWNNLTGVDYVSNNNVLPSAPISHQMDGVPGYQQQQQQQQQTDFYQYSNQAQYMGSHYQEIPLPGPSSMMNPTTAQSTMQVPMHQPGQGQPNCPCADCNGGQYYNTFSM